MDIYGLNLLIYKENYKFFTDTDVYQFLIWVPKLNAP